MKVLIDGTIPLSAGLSSSSALVVCAALTTVIANGVNIGKVYIFILFASYFILLFLESFGRSLC
jgi:galactokinase